MSGGSPDIAKGDNKILVFGQISLNSRPVSPMPFFLCLFARHLGSTITLDWPLVDNEGFVFGILFYKAWSKQGPHEKISLPNHECLFSKTITTARTTLSIKMKIIAVQTGKQPGKHACLYSVFMKCNIDIMHSTSPTLTVNFTANYDYISSSLPLSLKNCWTCLLNKILTYWGQRAFSFQVEFCSSKTY